jgi:hypothetical protein
MAEPWPVLMCGVAVELCALCLLCLLRRSSCASPMTAVTHCECPGPSPSWLCSLKGRSSFTRLEAKPAAILPAGSSRLVHCLLAQLHTVHR